MANILSKEEIIKQLTTASNDVQTYCSNINNELFFYPPADKWSIAQNIEHLIIAAKSTIPAYNLPKFIVRLYAGKTNRPSRTYDELVAKYQLKLANGGKAGGRFVPNQSAAGKRKEKLLQQLSSVMNKLSITIQQKWNDSQLDNYIAPHPLLGKITLRELGYFTIYHTYHHLAIIKERTILAH